VTCDYCGIKWYRSECRVDASGFLACPDDQDGRDQVTCDRQNQAAATEPTWKPKTGWER
jgi:hypothetical protein